MPPLTDAPGALFQEYITMRKSTMLTLQMIVVLLLVFVISAVSFTGCADTGVSSHSFTNQTTGIGDILANATSENTPPAETKESTTETTAGTSSKTNENIEIDLTTMSANMVYSQVFCMVMEPDEYIGTTVKMDGTFIHYYDEEKDKHYFACIIQDATQCCAQGIEFEPTDDYVYPDDFPEDGEEICVMGVFDKYSEDGNNYLTLRNAVLLPVTSE